MNVFFADDHVAKQIKLLIFCFGLNFSVHPKYLQATKRIDEPSVKNRTELKTIEAKH